MSFLGGFKLSRLIIVILVSVVSLTLLPSRGYCDDWVKIGVTEDYTVYYNSSSVEINKQNNIIKVWIKHKYTDKGKKEFLDKIKNQNVNVDSYKDINYSQMYFLLNYHELKGCCNHIIHYSKSGTVLDDNTFPNNWRDIPRDSLVDTILNKILSNGDYNNWVYVGGNKDFKMYYKSPSVKIDNINKTIEVWKKTVFSEKGKIEFLRNKNSIEKQKYIDMNYSLSLCLFDYKEVKFSINHLTYYSHSGIVLDTLDRNIKWINIPPDSEVDFFFNKILKDYHIQR